MRGGGVVKCALQRKPTGERNASDSASVYHCLVKYTPLWVCRYARLEDVLSRHGLFRRRIDRSRGKQGGESERRDQRPPPERDNVRWSRPFSWRKERHGGRQSSSVCRFEGSQHCTRHPGLENDHTLGTYKSANALRDALKAARCGIGDLAGGALDQPAFTVTKTETPVDLVVLSAAELVSEAESATLAEIYSRATQLGLELCPAEIAPRLRLQYPDQPAGELLHVAMEPIPTDRGPVAFTLGNGGAGLFLIGGDGRADRTVSSTARFVFVRPRPAAGLRS